MNTNKTIWTIVGIVAIAALIIAVAHGASTNQAEYPETTGSGTSQPLESINPNADMSSSTDSGSASGAAGGSATGAAAYTLADVTKHNNSTDCWTTINGSVYNVTSWISQHPGGADAIISLCGRDGTSDFTAQHGGQARPASELASFKIGVLR
jgi:cytochrome b involved in lipid metabolism